jgi:hypothetical protein
MTICLSGLDLSFLKNSPLPKKRGRPKKRVDHTEKRSSLPCPQYMPDIRPFVSPVGDWGEPNSKRKQPEVISSRKHLRDHVRAYDLIEAGNIKPGSIVKRNVAKKAALEEKAKGVTIEWA